MRSWLVLIGASALAGGVCGLLPGPVLSRVLAIAVPWCGLLAFVLYEVSHVLHWSPCTQFWPIAQLTGETVTAAVGGVVGEWVHRGRARDP